MVKVSWVLSGVVLLGCGSRSSVGEAFSGTDSTGAAMTVTGSGGAMVGSTSAGGSQTVGAGGSVVSGSGGATSSSTGSGGSGTGGGGGIPEPCADEGESMVGPRLICVPGGTFTLGDSLVTSNPREGVRVDSFWLDETEVTVSQYRQCVDSGVCSLPGQDLDCNWTDTPNDRESHPINCVDLRQALVFCDWGDKRLPSEVEWEFAARGPGRSPRIFPWGDEEAVDQLCWRRMDGTCPVGTFPAGDTPEGIEDMAGNLREFTTPCRTTDTLGCAYPAPGGSWITTEDFALRAGNPWNGVSDTHSTRVTGFRCAR